MFGNLTPIVKNLLLLNIGIFFVQFLIPGVNLIEVLGLRYFGSSEFKPWQFVTHLFMHAGLWHLFGNMLALFIFGPLLERVWSGKRFLTFYLITGLGASLLYSAVTFYDLNQLENDASAYLENPTPTAFNQFINEHASFAYRDRDFYDFINKYEKNPENSTYISQSKANVRLVVNRKVDIPLVGASGAVFGILMAFGMLFPNTELFLLFLPIPIKAKYFVALYGAYELWAGFDRMPGDNVAHFAHLGGMLFAFILVKIWQKQNTRFY